MNRLIVPEHVISCDLQADPPQDGGGGSSDESTGGGWLNVPAPGQESDDDPNGWPAKVPANPPNGRPLSPAFGHDPNTWPGNASSPFIGPQARGACAIHTPVLYSATCPALCKPQAHHEIM